MLAGEGEEREEVGDILGKRLWPGEKRDAVLAPLAEVGWKAEGKDLRMGRSPDTENIGLKRSVLHNKV